MTELTDPYDIHPDEPWKPAVRRQSLEIADDIEEIREKSDDEEVTERLDRLEEHVRRIAEYHEKLNRR